ncbi:MAG: XisH family protein [Acidobacteria bacterium]|nr:XisH family protein [Acidobacteriota bacterium]
MAARDKFHEAVKNGLVRDGWTITDDPLYLKISDKLDFYIDLGAEKLISAEKGGMKIAVEIKSFIGKSTLFEFHAALGQFLNYKLALQKSESERVLFLAVPQKVYNEFFTIEFIAESISLHQVKILVYDIEKEVIAEWIN